MGFRSFWPETDTKRVIVKRFVRRPKGRKSSRVVLFELTDRLDGKKAMDGRTVPLKPPDEPDVSDKDQNTSGGKLPGVMAGKPFRRPIRRMTLAKFMRGKKRIIKRFLIGAAVLLVVFWFFGLFGSADEPTNTPAGTGPETSETIKGNGLSETGNTPGTGDIEEEAPLPVSLKGNAIVIATYIGSEQLEPVGQYFLGKGIETEILKSGPRYMLVSKERFSGKSDPNYAGLKSKIQQAGKEYKAPEGFKAFGFDSIYLLNVSKIQ